MERRIAHCRYFAISQSYPREFGWSSRARAEASTFAWAAAAFRGLLIGSIDS